MKTNFSKIFFVLAALAFLLPVGKAEAAILDNGYLLTEASSFSVDSQSPTGSAKLKGIVYPLNAGDNPATAQVYFKSQQVGQSTVVQHPNFSSLPNGNFEQILAPVDCDETYNFWLYETPGDTLIQVDTVGGSLVNAFSMPIICSGGAPIGTPDDQMAPSAAQAQIIAGVNWGNVVVTDHSISINGAHIIPLVYGGSKTFKIEYGTGTADGNNEPAGGSTFLGYSQNITRSPPYNFSLQIGALAPNTNYYFNLWEVDGNTEGNLFTYGFTMTNGISSGSQGLLYTFPNATSVHVYGNLLNDGGQPLSGLPIDIEIHGYSDLNSPAIQSFSTTVGGLNIINGNGFYEHTFTGLTPSTVYYLVLRQSSGQEVLIGPVEFTMPEANVPTSTVTTTPPTYNGLVACGGVDCDFNSFIATINRVINFLIFYIAFPVVALVIAWAGIKLVTSGGSQEAKTGAKSIIKKVLIGFIVALLCWAIIKLILVTLGYVPPPGAPSGSLYCLFGINPQCP